jgi:hypothetical protein
MTRCNHAMICRVALPEYDVSKIIMLQTNTDAIYRRYGRNKGP